MNKAIDELKEKYLRLNFNDDVVDINDVINDLETLKEQLKEQHKEDIITAVKYGIFITNSGTKTEVADKESIEYYDDNH